MPRVSLDTISSRSPEQRRLAWAASDLSGAAHILDSYRGGIDMSDQTQGQMDESAEGMAIIRVQDNAYAVPVVVLEQHRIPEERRTELEAALRERAGEGEPPLFEVPVAVLDAYRLSDEDRAALEAADAGQGDDTQGFDHLGGPRNPYPISGYHGFHQNEFFGGYERGPGGGKVFVGVFPLYRQPLPPPAQPGMGLR
jgi:hypothetical protein